MDYSFRWLLTIYYGSSTVLDMSHVTVKRLSRTFRLNNKDVVFVYFTSSVNMQFLIVRCKNEA